MQRPLAIGLIIAALLAGALAGYLYWPRWNAPADGGEPRLRQRAESYYRAQRLADFRAMALHFTPARQTSEAADLARRAKDSDGMLSRFKDDTRNNLQRSADTVNASELNVELDGTWALTSGSCQVFVGEVQTDFPLPETIWVESGGDWWVYTGTLPELNAYGNPGPEMRVILERQQMMEAGSQSGISTPQIEVPGTRTLPEVQTQGAEPGGDSGEGSGG